MERDVAKMFRKIKGSNIKKSNPKIDRFLSEFYKLCKRHKMMLKMNKDEYEVVDFDNKLSRPLQNATDALHKVLQPEKPVVKPLPKKDVPSEL